MAKTPFDLIRHMANVHHTEWLQDIHAGLLCAGVLDKEIYVKSELMPQCARHMVFVKGDLKYVREYTANTKTLQLEIVDILGGTDAGKPLNVFGEPHKPTS